MAADQTFHMNLTADNSHWGLGVSSYNVNNNVDTSLYKEAGLVTL